MLDKFNAVAGLVLDRALETFPVPMKVDMIGTVLELPEEWRTPAGASGVKYGEVHADDQEYVFFVCQWLTEEGFLREFGSTLESYGGVLTAKGITALNAAPNWMDNNESLGNRLRKAVADRSWQLVAGIIPAVIGASMN